MNEHHWTKRARAKPADVATHPDAPALTSSVAVDVTEKLATLQNACPTVTEQATSQNDCLVETEKATPAMLPDLRHLQSDAWNVTAIVADKSSHNHHVPAVTEQATPRNPAEATLMPGICEQNLSKKTVTCAEDEPEAVVVLNDDGPLSIPPVVADQPAPAQKKSTSVPTTLQDAMLLSLFGSTSILDSTDSILEENLDSLQMCGSQGSFEV